MDARFKQRKVLARDQYARPLMTMARFVPWGIPPEQGIATIALARYLGIRGDYLHILLRRLGVETYWSSPEDSGRSTRGQRKLVSEEGAARLIVHVRARDGARILRSKASPAAPPPESTGGEGPSS